MKRWLALSQLARTKKVHKSGAGYTITEVVIVLAVTTIMFAAMVLAFNGRQMRVEFNQAVRNYEARIQNVVSEVAKGYYRAGFTCTTGVSGPPNITAGSQQPGTNDQCIFLGKVVASGTQDSLIITVLGRRLVGAAGTADVATWAQAWPAAVPINIAGEDFFHTYGLEVRKVVRLSNTNTNVGAFGFISQLSGGVASSGGGGSRSIQLHGITGSTPSTPINNTAAQISSLVPLNDGILICLLGDNGQRAEITVGASGSQSGITTVLDTTNSGACFE